MIEFVKAHGAGNDFVLVEDPSDRLRPSAAFVAAVCDRRTGVGADGFIRIAPSAEADFFMDYYNADGEAAEMCGNGIRCLAKIVSDAGRHDGDAMRVGTRAGIRELRLHREAGAVRRVRVDMGEPILDPEAIPVRSDGDPLHERVSVGTHAFVGACVSMGNPHYVVFVDDVDAVDVRGAGPLVERAEKFPARTNVEFAQVVAPDEVVVRVWERGSGETMACGTGACATVVAGSLLGRLGRGAAVRLPGGVLEVEWASNGRVYLTGPAEEVFRGSLSERWTGLLEGRTPA